MAQIVTGVNTANGYYENSEYVVPSGSFSIEMIFTMPESEASTRGFLATGSVDANCIRINSTTGNLNIAMYGVSGGTPVDAGKQCHLIITIDSVGKKASRYRNGAIMGIASSFPNDIDNNRLRIGKNNSTSAGFSGVFHLFRVFNRVLTADEVKSRYNNGKPEVWVEPDGSGCIAEFRAFSATTVSWEESRGNGLQLSMVGAVALETVDAITTGIPWGDKSKDSITATFTGAAAESPMLLGTERNDTIFIREKVIKLKTPDGTVLGQITVDQVPT